MSRRSKLWLLATIVLVAAQAFAALLIPRGYGLTAFSDLLQALLLLSGTLALVPNVLATRGRTRGFWVLMAVGVAFWFSYQLCWIYFEVYRRQELPALFSGDIILFLHIVPMMAALALQPQRQQDDRTTRLGSLDFTLLLVWWVYLYLFTVIPWLAYPNELSYQQNLNAIYLAEKIVFLAGLALVWTRSSPSWKTIYGQLFGASLTYSLSSYVATWAIQKHVYYTGSLYDIPLVVSMGWFTVFALLAREIPPRQERTLATGHGVWVARLGMAAIFSLPLFAASALLGHAAPGSVQKFRLLLTLGAIMVMGAMVFLKQHLLDRELLGLLRASQNSFEDLKRLQAQLVQSEKLASLGQLVGGAAHELNNPLTAMLGYADLLACSDLNHEQRSLADKIGQQVRRTKALVASLLSFAKQAPGQKVPVDINVLAQTAVKLFQPHLRARKIEVRTQLATKLPAVLGDSNQLLQVFMHISNNALQALEERGGGIFIITTERDGDKVVLEFCDNGPGAQQPDRVFDPFYTTKPVGQGTGLGLSACYGIVQEHKGKISCHNRPEGGAVFRIELPALGANQTSFSDESKPRAAGAAVGLSSPEN
ncbi:MAG TPA: ATP-binding protein [Terriglobales bacterium]|nr:ATP-binding protein [Terriglobales bacterium]